jgi:hypothetical protein
VSRSFLEHFVYGRNDKLLYNLSSRPERSVVEGPAFIRSKNKQ